MDTNVYFFDIGGTLGTVELSSQDPLVIITFTPLPNVGSSLHRLRSAHCRLGIISDIGPVTSEAVQQVKSALAGAGLLSAFENELLLFGAKNSKSPSFGRRLRRWDLPRAQTHARLSARTQMSASSRCWRVLRLCTPQ